MLVNFNILEPPTVVNAAQKTSNTTKLIKLYKPRGGGILGSLHVNVHTKVYNKSIKNNSKSKNIRMDITVSAKKAPASLCGVKLYSAAPTSIGNTKVAVKKDNRAYIRDATKL